MNADEYRIGRCDRPKRLGAVMDLRGDKIFRALLALENALAAQGGGRVTITLPEHLALAARQCAERHSSRMQAILPQTSQDDAAPAIRRSNFRIGRVMVLWAGEPAPKPA